MTPIARLLVAIGIFTIVIPHVVIAQEYDAATVTLDTVVVRGIRRAVPAPEWSSALLPPAPGGQVATGSALGILGNRDNMETPFSITGYTAKYIQDSQARSIADVAAADPSVRVVFPRASYRDVYLIRGFNLFSYNVALDGLYGIAPKQRYPAEFAERIEILKGPDTFLNGASLGGSVGGAINIVPKRATQDRIATTTVSYTPKGNFGGHVDYGKRFGEDNEFGIRVNGLVRDGDLVIDDQSERLGAAALSLDYLGERLRLYGDFGIQTQKIDSPDWAVTVAPDVTSIPVPSSTANLSQPWAWVKSKDRYVMLRGEYDISDNWTAFGAFGASTTETQGIFVQAVNLKPNGDYTGTINAFPSNGTSYTWQAGLRGTFNTGPVEHNIAVAGTRQSQNLKAAYGSFGRYPSNIHNPVQINKPDNASLINLNDIHRTAEHRLSSLAVADTMSLFDQRLLLTLGGRWQRIINTNFDAASGVEKSSYDEAKFSPAIGAVYKLTENVSLYGNYVEALQQGPSAPLNAINHGETFPPVVSRQIEAGVKLDWGTWSSSVAAFQITRPYGILDPATRIYALDGEQRNRGIELTAWGSPFDGMRVLGGVTWLDGEQVKTAGGAYDGKRVIGVPGYQANLGVEWDTPFINNLTLSGRIIATGKQYVNTPNTQHIGAWTRLDLGARYVFKRSGGNPITLRFTVENVLNESYWASASAGQISGVSRGAPRTFLLSSSFQF